MGESEFGNALYPPPHEPRPVEATEYLLSVGLGEENGLGMNQRSGPTATAPPKHKRVMLQDTMAMPGHVNGQSADLLAIDIHAARSVFATATLPETRQKSRVGLSQLGHQLSAYPS